jgi:hypothetical protein
MAELNEFGGDAVADHACAEECDFHVCLCSLVQVTMR